MKKNKLKTPTEKNNKARLALSEYDAILNSIPDVVIRFSLTGKIVWWNKNLKDVISIPQNKLLNCHFSELFILCNDTSIIDETITNGDAESDAYLGSVSEGKRYHLKSTLIKNTIDGCITGKEVLVVGRDIDDRAQMSDALKQSQSQLKKLMDSLPFLVLSMTTDNKFLFANKGFCNFVDLPSSEIIGIKSEDVFDDKVVDFFLRDNNKILKEQCPVHYEGSIELNRSHINLSVDKFPLFDEANEIYAICAVIEDVTSQFQLQRQLQQTQKMEAIGQLSGGIAHDFNNVLASIMGYTGLIKRRIVPSEDETTVGYLEQITRAGERARDLVQQLLAFSRGDVDSLQILEPEPLTKEVVKMLTSLIPSSVSMNLKIRSNNVKYHIEVDPVQFNQSLMNLVINAKDSIVDETGHIDISLAYLPHAKGICDSCHSTFSGKFIEISVTDSGEGIDPKLLSRIFDPFFTTKDVGKGSGMGLSMIHGIVHCSGGHIVVKSRMKGAKKGTSIKLYFPFVSLEKTAQDNISELTPDYVVEDQYKEHHGKTILLIDDETLITQYLTAVLKQHNYNIIAFNDPVKALSFFTKNSYKIDIIISDQTMPNLTGLELAKNILHSQYIVPFVLCSGYSDFSIDTSNPDTGIDVVLNKPFKENVLLQHISQLLELYNQ